MAIYKLGLDCVLTVGGSQVKDAKDVTLKPSLGTTPTFSCATASTSSGSGTGS